MRVTVNGESKDVQDGSTVGELVRCFHLTPQRVAVEVNESLVPRARLDEVHLSDADRVEIVTFMGGGLG